MKLGVWKHLTAIVLIVAALAGVFSHVMSAPLNHNEHMYVAASVLGRDLAMYD